MRQWHCNSGLYLAPSETSDVQLPWGAAPRRQLGDLATALADPACDLQWKPCFRRFALILTRDIRAGVSWHICQCVHTTTGQMKQTCFGLHFLLSYIWHWEEQGRLPVTSCRFESTSMCLTCPAKPLTVKDTSIWVINGSSWWKKKYELLVWSQVIMSVRNIATHSRTFTQSLVQSKEHDVKIYFFSIVCIQQWKCIWCYGQNRMQVPHLYERVAQSLEWRAACFKRTTNRAVTVL